MLLKSSLNWFTPLAVCAFLVAVAALAVGADPPRQDLDTITEAENVQRAAEQAPHEAQQLPPEEIVEKGKAADAHSPRMRGGRARSQRGYHLPPQYRTGYRGSPDAPFIPPNPDGAYLGVELNREFPEAAIVSRVLPGTAAAAAGLREGDRIWGINEQRVETANELIFRLGQIAPGESVEVHFDRAHSVPVTLGQRGQAPANP